MKLKILPTSLAFLLIFSCSKSDRTADTTIPLSQSPFTLNNLRADASLVNSWISNTDYDRVVLTFFSPNMSNINSNLSMAAFPYEKNELNPATQPVILSIAGVSSLPIEENAVFSNNTVTIAAIKKAVTNTKGNIDFDYLLFEPRYFHYGDNKSYIGYKLTAFKGGAPISVNSSNFGGDCDLSNPSPPADPCH